MNVFVTGGTGYLGRRAIPALCARGHRVRALVRPGSERRLPPGAELVRGDALDAATFSPHTAGADVLLHLVGTPHPAPHKARLFRDVDLVSVREAVQAALENAVRHFVYASVAQPAPVMRAYVAARAAGEELIRRSGLNATILRPWYVLGPGHRWPLLLLPLYWLAELVPGTRETARRLRPVTLARITQALCAPWRIPGPARASSRSPTSAPPAVRSGGAACRS